MKQSTQFILTLLFTSVLAFGQQKRDLNINYMLPGNMYAQSSMEDEDALGGFGGSNNKAHKIKTTDHFIEEGLFLKIDTLQTATLNDTYNAYLFYIVNKTDSIARFEASDSRLDVLAEVWYKNKWQPIEYLASSWCGNSYHVNYLASNEYWSFVIPKFAGKIKTKLRYKLMLGNGENIYSNEIMTSINKKQLTKKPN